ncbi:type II toxin-antitoxin system VapC family toxin [Pseudonocardia asaccharolytica]|uniref:Ribonuclease VapC n=1 Tax=Pseudonocardia asaccharolytica DSM 44247 = NBRC 16224 TaxID=1123024 RepID=A0A511D883_9PSEU|nr:type II toxin-antitoxin system VapC family toxin [Pseudonocardia asaccharolytica]GEL20986.1 ribonuclease VapC28 [Pseudonocardia asaccharolytica DSM 44247 = NBRC 16224]
MIVDTSALIAILRDEPDAESLALALAATEPRISVANYLETAIVIDSGRDPVASRQIDHLVAKAGLVLEPVTAEQTHVARAAYRDFGRGSGHPAKLNFGDCFAYALAMCRGEPLLFKGNDFTHTDVIPAPADHA